MSFFTLADTEKISQEKFQFSSTVKTSIMNTEVSQQILTVTNPLKTRQCPVYTSHNSNFYYEYLPDEYKCDSNKSILNR